MKPVLLITGAAHGLGRALALGAARDYKLALLDRERVAGEQLADALRRDGAEVLFVPVSYTHLTLPTILLV